MYCKWNAMFPVKKQVSNDTRHVQHQFDGGLQHEHPAECFGLFRYGFHYPIMGCAGCQPHDANANYT